MKKRWLIVIIVLAALYIMSSWIGNIADIDTTDKIAIVPLTGMIVPEDISISLYQKGTSSKDIIDSLSAAMESEKVKGIIIEINSPGGTVVASREIAEAVKKSEKPIVALIKDVGASGAYWVASAADIIVADPLSMTGSIGVTASYLEFSGLLDKYGVEYQSLKSGELKEAGSPFRDLTPGERSMLQKKISKIHEVFIEEVAKNRGIDKEIVKKFATGEVFLGQEAYENGLIDYLGGKDLAVNLTKEAAGITEAKLVTYKKEKSIFEVLSSLSTPSSYALGQGIGDALMRNQLMLPHV